MMISREHLFGGHLMRIALAQLNPTIGALSQNTERIKHYYHQALTGQAEVVIFSELALIGYPPQDLLLYEDLINQEQELLKKEVLPLTKKYCTPIIIGVTHVENSKLYNAALVLENGLVKSVHKKTLLPNYDVFDEARYFTRCTERKIELLGTTRSAITICEDIWNDQDFFSPQIYDIDPVEILFEQDANLLINLSASPYNLGKQKLREKLLSFLAKKYRSGVLYLNQVGGNDELIFDGSSMAYNSQGQLLYRARSFNEELFFVNTEDLYKPVASPIPPAEETISTVVQALKLGIREYIHKTGFSKVILGLSGGIDSAVCAVLAADTIGPENVLGIMMPSPYSSEHSLEDALLLAKNLNIEYRIIQIDDPYYSYLKLLNKNGNLLEDIAEENLQARIRGNILMHISNREGYMTLATGNKSELAVGYCTLYGDMSGGLAALADLPKTMVYELAEELNKAHGSYVIPERTITKAPSAELRPNQRDDDSLPAYDILDPILQMYIEENSSPAEIINAGFTAETVNRVVHMVDRAEFKRRQAAPGLRITTRAFGSGRRMPIARSYEP